ncbi:DUF3618 domain-containing protein [Jannaschia sp.]|nr:DUF3618 domain-containing protein [Jannaschia sp.]
MTNDPKTAELEAEIAEERNALADSLSQLTSQLSPENLVSSVGETLKSQSDELAHAVVRGAKDNPAALALVGAGLAWLLMSKSTSDQQPTTAVAYDTRPYEPVAGFRNGSGEDAAFKARVAAAEAALREPHASDDPSMFDQAKSFMRRSAAEMRSTIYEGTSELGDLARERVIDARRKALLAQERAEHQGRVAQARSKTFYSENPLAVGAGVVALGVGVAMALPRTQVEDDTFGAHRDALIAEADRVMHEEMSRAKAMAFAAMDEAEIMAKEAVDDIPSGDEAVARAEAKVRTAGERIAARAQDAKAH